MSLLLAAGSGVTAEIIIPAAGAWSSRKKRLNREEFAAPQDLSARDAEIRELILVKLESKKAAIKDERNLLLPVLEIANEINKTQNKLQQITGPVINLQQLKMLLALMMELM